MPFRKKIDNCRDYLVGKIPDPKGQVDQITNAMIYKFMSDLDQISTDAGGVASYFVDQGERNKNGNEKETSLYEKHSWKYLFNSTLTNTEKAQLYIDGLEKLSNAKHLPDFFQNIFKDAYLPFRDANTIVHFLTEINGFKYTNSEDLGNAFEYLLKIMGSQGNAGQFRTPRHIIDFIVDIVNPQPGQTIYDPACGTAGFLISANNHIVKNNTLTPTQKLALSNDISGVDIDPGMAKIARVNLFFHNFKSPNISEDDTLSNQKLWGKKFDVILANPPFMTPRGGIHPHDGYTINSTKAEVLFTSYIAQHLKLGGKAGIIVPEGIIFQAANAYKQLRKMLIDENLLYGVVSLPAGIFQPYSGVKTSILLLDRDLAPKTDKILFAKVEQDGFSMSTQRKEHVHNDLPEMLQEIRNYQTSIQESTEYKSENLNVFTVEKSTLAEDQEYNLSAERYKLGVEKNTIYEIVELGEIAEVISGQSPLSSNYNEEGKGLPFFQGKTEFQERYLGSIRKWTTQTTKESIKGDILMSVRAPVGPININIYEKICIGRGLCAIRPNEKVLFDFLYNYLKSIQKEINGNGGAVFDSISRNDILKIKIPLPPLDIQQLIVDELDGYQKIIDGAKQVVNNYKPTIEIDESWEMEELGKVCDVRDGTHDSPKYVEDGIPLITSKNLKDGTIDFGNIKYISQEDHENISRRSGVDNGDVLFAMIGTIGNPIIVQKEREFSIKNVALFKFGGNEKLINRYLCTLLDSIYTEQNLVTKSRGGTQKFISLGDIRKFKIPLPPLDIQQTIVLEIEREQGYIDGCKELIKIFEKKIENKVSEIWGEKNVKS